MSSPCRERTGSWALTGYNGEFSPDTPLVGPISQFILLFMVEALRVQCWSSPCPQRQPRASALTSSLPTREGSLNPFVAVQQLHHCLLNGCPSAQVCSLLPILDFGSGLEPSSSCSHLELLNLSLSPDILCWVCWEAMLVLLLGMQLCVPGHGNMARLP